MAVTTRLSFNKEKNLRKLFGNASLSLLYKSSVHTNGIRDLIEKCNPEEHEVYVDKVVEKELEFTFGRCQPCECEVFRVEGIKNNPSNVKKIVTVTQHRDSLLNSLRAYKPPTRLVSQVRILLLGPVGSGKSSFFNSVKSIFYGHTTRQAMVGSANTSITEQYRVYSIKDGGRHLPFILCDSMGLDEKDEEGLCVGDIPCILQGSVPDRYQFNPCNPITAKHPNFILNTSTNDWIHCVVYVLDINSVDHLSAKMVAKLNQIHKAVLNCGAAHVALLTKVSDYREILEDNFLNMTKQTLSQSQVMKVNKLLGIPVFNILMVENYVSERELDPFKDVVILSALRQMLRATDDFLEDSRLQETVLFETLDRLAITLSDNYTE
ncbi:interferon-induced protein 44-like [Ctenodactylus gundi]